MRHTNIAIFSILAQNLNLVYDCPVKKLRLLQFGVLLLPVALIFIFFRPYLTGNNLFFAADEGSSDLVDFNYPQRVYVAQQLRQGKIPLWTPYQAYGFPLLAEAQSGVFYPPNLILFSLFRPPLAFNLSILSALVILSLGTYFYFKYLHLHTFTCAVSASLICFTAFFIAHLRHVQLLESAAYLPWVLLFIEKIIETEKAKSAIFLAFTLAFSFLAGHIPTNYALILIAVIYFLLAVNQENRTRKESIKPILLFFMSFLLAGALVAIQLIPTLEMVAYSTRQTFAPMEASHLPLKQLLTFINPYFFGDPGRSSYRSDVPVSFWESAGYIGLLPLMLGFIVFLKRSRLRHSLIVSRLAVYRILIVLSLFFILGVPTQFFKFLWQFVPLLTLTRLPVRFLLFLTFFLFLLFAVCLEQIIKSRLKYRYLLVLGIFILTLTDLGYYFYGHYGQMPAKDVLAVPQTAQFLLKDKEDFRIFTHNQRDFYQLAQSAAGGWRGNLRPYLTARELLSATTNSLYGVKSVHFPNEYAGAFSLEESSSLSILTQGEMIFLPAAAKLLGLQNIKYVLAQDLEPVPEGFIKVFSASSSGNLPPINVYRNSKFLSRAYLVPGAVILPRDKIISFLVSPDFDPSRQVILEKAVTLDEVTDTRVGTKVEILADDTDRLQIQVQTPESAFLVLSDSYYPDWTAQVDNVETEILRADYAFRALPISAGTHRVEFVYQPKSFFWGAFISGVAVCGIILYSLIRSAVKTRQ